MFIVCFMVVIAITIVALWLWSSLPLMFHSPGRHCYCYFVVTIVIAIPWSPLLLMFYGHSCHHCYCFMVVVIIIIVYKVFSPSLLFVSWSWSPSLLLFFLLRQGISPLSCFVQVWGVKCGAWIGFNSNYICLG